jgi:cytochrome c1
MSIQRFILAACLFAIFTCACDRTEKYNKARYDYIKTMTGGDPAKGQVAIFKNGCGSCHTIPGVKGADALVGPNLSQIGSRMYIAGVLKNTPENMIEWIKNPPGVDPKTAMPNMHLAESDVRDIASYLYTLR